MSSKKKGGGRRQKGNKQKMNTLKSTADKGRDYPPPHCYVCMEEETEDAPFAYGRSELTPGGGGGHARSRACACRNDSGLAHLRCLSTFTAVNELNVNELNETGLAPICDDTSDGSLWLRCNLCRQAWSGELKLGMARAHFNFCSRPGLERQKLDESAAPTEEGTQGRPASAGLYVDINIMEYLTAGLNLAGALRGQFGEAKGVQINFGQSQDPEFTDFGTTIATQVTDGIRLARMIVANIRTVYGPKRHEFFAGMGVLADLYAQAGNLPLSLATQEKTLSLLRAAQEEALIREPEFRASNGGVLPDAFTAELQINIAETLLRIGGENRGQILDCSVSNAARALPLIAEAQAALECDACPYGKDHPLVLRAQTVHSVISSTLGDWEVAAQMDKAVWESNRRVFGRDHVESVIAGWNLTTSLSKLGGEHHKQATPVCVLISMNLH